MENQEEKTIVTDQEETVMALPPELDGMKPAANKKRSHHLFSAPLFKESLKSNRLGLSVVSAGNALIMIIIVGILSTLNINSSAKALKNLFNNADTESTVKSGAISFYSAFANSAEAEESYIAGDKMAQALVGQAIDLVNDSSLQTQLATLKITYDIAYRSASGEADAKAIAATGAKAIQLHTGGMCHLDAEMTRQGLEGLGPQDVDLVVLENVGNLVCPAEFDTGAVKNAMILSVPEGDDKPLKYPLMFQVCDVVLINKIDVLPYFDFDMDKCREYIAMRNPNAKVIPICAKTSEGIAEWADWLREQVKTWQA